MHEVSPGLGIGNANKGNQSTIKSNPRKKFTDSGPDPTLYPGDHIYKTGKDEGLAFTIKGRIESFPGNHNPGPGNYDTQGADSKTKPSKPSYSFGIKSKDFHDQFPGPGTYEIDKAQPTNKGFSIGKRIKKLKPIKKPGPGDYNINPKVYRNGPDGKHGFSINGRSDSFYGQLIPGPGSYDDDKSFAKTIHKVRAADFGGKANPLPADDIPPPGSYNPSWNVHTKKYEFGRKVVHLKPFETPSPAQYKIDSKLCSDGKHTGRVVQITGRPSHSLKNNIPGPADYSVQNRYEGKGISMSARHDMPNSNLVPGPGAYKPLSAKTTRKYIMVGKPKENLGKKTPGPFDYVIEDRLTRKGKQGGTGFTMKGRVKLWKTENTPGPGAYSPRPGDRTNGPEWSFGDQTDTGYGNQNPGPGSYNCSDNQHIKGFRIVKDQNKSNSYCTPAPNYYEISPDIANKLGRAAPVIRIGGKFYGERRNSHPGPGTYDQEFSKCKNDGPLLTFGEKFEENLDSNPGPGQYQLDPMLGRTVRSNKPSSPSYSFGARTHT